MNAAPGVHLQSRCGLPAAPADIALEDGAHLVLRRVGLYRNGKWLFRNLELTVPRGQFVAVLGPSGVGKSSLLSCMAGLLTPSEGEITYRCQHACLHAPCSFQKRIGIVFQNLMLIRNSSLLNNVLCGRLGRLPWWKTAIFFPREEKEDAFRVLYDLGLAHLVHRWVGEVSGGEQQRTAIARALFQEPEIILADEPVSNLDSYLTGRVLGIFKQQARLHQRTIFCVLHNPELVARFADHALSLSPGDPEGWDFHPVKPVPAHS
jgi:phosphonate transport system ATP-binding protein